MDLGRRSSAVVADMVITTLRVFERWMETSIERGISTNILSSVAT